MNEETARYLASYLIENHKEFLYYDYDDLVWTVENMTKTILTFFEELP